MTFDEQKYDMTTEEYLKEIRELQEKHGKEVVEHVMWNKTSFPFNNRFGIIKELKRELEK